LSIPARRHRRDSQAHGTLLGELEGIGEKILEDLFHPPLVGGDGGGELRIELARELEILGLRDGPEGALDEIADVADARLRRLQLDRARLDARKVEHLVDELEQVVAGGLDRARVLHLFLGQVALAVFGQDLGKDEQAVKRRAQLVRHVGEELRLVARGLRDLLGLVLQVDAGLLDLAVGLLDLLFLEREQVGLFLDLLVRLLKLLVRLLDFLVRLLELLLLFLQENLGIAQVAVALAQFRGHFLRLDEQFLRTLVGRDGVEHDAEAFGHPLDESDVHRGRRLQQR